MTKKKSDTDCLNEYLVSLDYKVDCRLICAKCKKDTDYNYIVNPCEKGLVYPEGRYEL